MDDCNQVGNGDRRAGGMVQIPLWTIVTKESEAEHTGEEGSDSSMDDCNERLTAALTPIVSGSDSSMDDCNQNY